jgi:uncharacterized protein YegL
MEKMAGKKRRIDLLNEMVKGFFATMASNPDARSITDVAFVAFTDRVIFATQFVNIMNITEESLRNVQETIPGLYEPSVAFAKSVKCERCESRFRREGVYFPKFCVDEDETRGTEIGNAIVFCVDMINQRINYLVDEEKCSKIYPPFLILLSDGNDLYDSARGVGCDLRNEQRAIDLLAAHSSTHRNENNLIIPFVVALGDENTDVKRMDRYAANFTEKCFHVVGETADECFGLVSDLICKSVTLSINLKDWTLIKTKARKTQQHCEDIKIQAEKKHT